MSLTNRVKATAKNIEGEVQEAVGDRTGDTNAQTEGQEKQVEASVRPAPLGAGYTVDDGGILNNYAIEPQMSESEYPSPKQQQRYIFLGAGAILLVSLAVWIAFAVSQA